MFKCGVLNAKKVAVKMPIYWCLNTAKMFYEMDPWFSPVSRFCYAGINVTRCYAKGLRKLPHLVTLAGKIIVPRHALSSFQDCNTGLNARFKKIKEKVTKL